MKPTLEEFSLLLTDWTSLALDDEADRRLLALLLADRFGTKPFVQYKCFVQGTKADIKHDCRSLASALTWCEKQARRNRHCCVAFVGIDEYGMASGALREWNDV